MMMSDLARRFKSLSHWGWWPVRVSEQRLVLLNPDATEQDSYTLADLDAGRTAGLYELLHAQAYKKGLRVNLDSNPDPLRQFAHTVTVDGPAGRATDWAADPITALVLALIRYQQQANQPKTLLGKVRERLAG